METVTATDAKAEVSTESKDGRVVVKPIGQFCARCKAETSTKCSGCKDVNYCSVVCQRLDWVKHKAACRKRLQQNTDPSHQSKRGEYQEKLVGQSNGHEVDPQLSSCERKEGSSGKGESLGLVRSTTLPH